MEPPYFMLCPVCSKIFLTFDFKRKECDAVCAVHNSGLPVMALDEIHKLL